MHANIMSWEMLAPCGRRPHPLVCPCYPTLGHHNRSAFGMRCCSSICLLEKQLHSWYAAQSARKRAFSNGMTMLPLKTKRLETFQRRGTAQVGILQAANPGREGLEENTLLWEFQNRFKARTQCIMRCTTARIGQVLGYGLEWEIVLITISLNICCMWDNK